MSKTAALGIAFVLLLVAFPLISIGTWQGIAALWWLGLALLLIGGLLPPISRYAFGDDDEEGHEAEGTAE